MNKNATELRRLKEHNAYWIQIAKLLVYKLTKAGVPAELTEAEIQTYAKEWPDGEVSIEGEQGKGVKARLVTHAECLKIDAARAAKR